MKTLDLHDSASRSPEIVAESISALRQLFPEAWNEGRLDFEVLKQLTGLALDDAEEKYGLSWKGKRQARQLALMSSGGTVRPRTDASVDWESTRNVLIDGDNLEVLKLLQKSYTNQVKMVYLDPPNNTGRDFVYADDFRDGVANYKRQTGQEQRGAQRSSRNETSGRLHTDWLNMMYPRLKLARNLLCADGVMLVSINDIEAPHVRLLLNEIFGEENFLCQFVWNNDGNVDQQSKIKGVHEYIIAYVKSIDAFRAPTVIDPNIEESSKLYNDRIENSITKNGPANPPSTIQLPVGFPAAFEEGTIAARDTEWPHLLDEIVVSGGRLAAPARVASGWSSRNLLELFINNGCVPIADATGKETWFALTATGAIYGYKRRSEQQGHVLSVIRNVGTTKQNSNMLAAWGIHFSYPKPVYLLEWLTRIFTQPSTSDVIVDLFAGSGTTGHAVYRVNASDGGNRRFLLVQLPETLAEPDADLLTLADLTAERLRRSGALVRAEHPLFPGDHGFRRFVLDSSNFTEWDPHATDLEQATLDSVLSIKPGRSDHDLICELMLMRGISLSAETRHRTIATHAVHHVEAGHLFACLSESIATQDVEPLAMGIIAWRAECPSANDDLCVFRDSAFTNDVTKTNLTAILQQYGITRVESL